MTSNTISGYIVIQLELSIICVLSILQFRRYVLARAAQGSLDTATCLSKSITEASITSVKGLG